MRKLLPVDPDFEFDVGSVTCVLEDEAGKPAAAATYWPLLYGMELVGAAIGVPPKVLKELEPHEAALLLPPVKPCLVYIKVHDGHPGAERLLQALGFKNVYGTVYRLFVPWEVNLTSLPRATRWLRQGGQAPA